MNALKRPFKYEIVMDVVRHAFVTDTPDGLAERVRRMDPRGTYEPVRICEDLNRIIRQNGQFTAQKVHATKADLRHAEKLIESFKKRELWVTR